MEMRSTPVPGHRPEIGFPHVAGGLDKRPPVDPADGLRHVFEAHVIQHNDVRPALQGRVDLREALGLHFDLQHMRGRAAGPRHGLIICSPAARMWLSLMRTPSQRLKRWFRPPPTLTAYFSSTRRPGVVFRVSVMAAWVPATIRTALLVRVAMPERRCRKFSANPFAGEDAPGGAFDAGDQVAFFYGGPLGQCRLEHYGGVQELKNTLQHRQSADDAVFLRHETAGDLPALLHRGEGGDIAAADILFQRAPDDRVHGVEVRYHGFFQVVHLLAGFLQRPGRLPAAVRPPRRCGSGRPRSACAGVPPAGWRGRPSVMLRTVTACLPRRFPVSNGSCRLPIFDSASCRSRPFRTMPPLRVICPRISFSMALRSKYGTCGAHVSLICFETGCFHRGQGGTADVEGAAPAEDQTFQQGVAGQTVRAVQRPCRPPRRRRRARGPRSGRRYPSGCRPWRSAAPARRGWGPCPCRCRSGGSARRWWGSALSGNHPGAA